MMHRLFLIALSLPFFTGCSVLEAEDQQKVGGEIVMDEDPFFNLPPTIQAGVPFTISFNTRGDGCFDGGPTEVAYDDKGALVIAFDYVTTDYQDAICPSVLKYFPHEATVQLDQTGSTELRFLTWNRQDAYPWENPQVIAFTVQVE